MTESQLPHRGNGEDPAFSLKILGQHVGSLSFKSHSVPDPGSDDFHKIALQASVETSTKGGKDRYGVTINVTASGTSRDSGERTFDLTVDYVGMFEVTGISGAPLEQCLHVECPRLVFPFLNNVICDVTREAGFPPLIIKSMDFDALYRKHKVGETAPM